MVNLNPYGMSVDPFELFVFKTKGVATINLRKRMPRGE